VCHDVCPQMETEVRWRIGRLLTLSMRGRGIQHLQRRILPAQLIEDKNGFVYSEILPSYPLFVFDSSV